MKKMQKTLILAFLIVTPQIFGIPIKNKANFHVKLTLTTKEHGLQQPLTLSPGQQIENRSACITSAKIEGTNKKGLRIGPLFSNFNCPRSEILINDDNDHTRLVLKIDGSQVAKTPKIK